MPEPVRDAVVARLLPGERGVERRRQAEAARVRSHDAADARRQRRPLDLDCLDRIPRDIDGFGDDKGDGVADMAHLVPGKDRIGRTGERIVFKIEQARQVAKIADILCREDQRDAGKAAGAGRINGEFRVRMRRAQHQRMHGL